MRYIPRELEAQVLRAVKNFPAVVLTGPRRAGKTWLLRHLFPRTSYFLLEDPDIVARFRADPQGFLDAVQTPAILDEVQNVPEVFAFVRAHRPAAAPHRPVAAHRLARSTVDAGCVRVHGRPHCCAATVPAFRARRLRSHCFMVVIPKHWLGRPRRGCGSVPTCRPTWSGMSGR